MDENRTSKELFEAWLAKMIEDKSIKEDRITKYVGKDSTIYYLEDNSGYRTFTIGFYENGFCPYYSIDVEP